MSGPVVGKSEKTLCNMPPDVRMSALMNRRGIVAGWFPVAESFASYVLSISVFLSPLVAIAWIVMLIPADSFIEAIPKARLCSTAFLATVFIGCVGYRLLFELWGRVPRKDREYPIVWVASLVPGLLSKRYGSAFPLSWVAMAYSGLLWVSWWNGWQALPTARHTLGYAVASSAIGAAAYWYGRVLPFHGYHRPSAEDLAAWLKKQAQARQTQAYAAQSPNQSPDYATPVQGRAARLKFSDIHGMAAVKKQMHEAATRILQPRHDFGESPRNGILLHGEPGNGKTAFAEALAGELDIPLVELTYGSISSKWLGEMPRLIANSFTYAKQNAPCVLFVDEIDTFIRSRDGLTHSEDLKVTNTMLTEIVSLRDQPVVLVAATNYLSLLDAAAIREGRFDFKVEVSAPDDEARIGLLEQGARRYLPGIAVDPQALRSIAGRWSGFSVSRLLAVVKALPGYASEHALSRIGFDDWMAALRQVQGRKGQVPSSAKRLDDLILEDETRDALTLIAHRLRNPEKVEAMGGTLPGGILFHGPSGTGKTVAAQALALESGWAFLSVAGPDLIAERDRMNKLYREASDLRPALVFIDEADDVLRERRMSGTPDVVNRLLALMDGTSGRVADVIFIAATNHPEQIDPALLRAGRFTEKVAFYPPPARELPRAIENWLNARNVKLDAAIETSELANILTGCTIADLEGVLQYALNRAIARDPDSSQVLICGEDLDAALKVVRT